jgi:hypothetical protein
MVVGGAMTLLVEHLGDERQQRVQRLKVCRLTRRPCSTAVSTWNWTTKAEWTDK